MTNRPAMKRPDDTPFTMGNQWTVAAKWLGLVWVVMGLWFVMVEIRLRTKKRMIEDPTTLPDRIRSVR